LKKTMGIPLVNFEDAEVDIGKYLTTDSWTYDMPMLLMQLL
jgi:hypothetical protein